MNTNHIPILLEVFHCRSINKAAQNLFLSQPQISHIIRKVEDEVGFAIFNRTRSGVTVTPQGELYLESLRIISGELKKIQAIPFQFEERQDISIASVYSRFFFHAFLSFQAAYPVHGTTDCYLEDMYDAVIEQVASGKVRLGLITRFKDLPGQVAHQLDRYGLECIPLFDGLPTLAFMSKNHPLAAEKKLSLRQIQDQAIVYFQGSDLDYLGSLLQRKTNVIQLLIQDRASFLEAVDSGNYISLSNTSSDQVTEGNKYAYLPVEGINYTSEACCIKPRLYEPTWREKQLIQFLKNTFIRYYQNQ